MHFAEMKLIVSHKTQSFTSFLFPDGDCFLNSNKVGQLCFMSADHRGHNCKQYLMLQKKKPFGRFSLRRQKPDKTSTRIAFVNPTLPCFPARMGLVWLQMLLFVGRFIILFLLGKQSTDVTCKLKWRWRFLFESSVRGQLSIRSMKSDQSALRTEHHVRCAVVKMRPYDRGWSNPQQIRVSVSLAVFLAFGSQW